jgi:hypothetical protein
MFKGNKRTPAQIEAAAEAASLKARAGGARLPKQDFGKLALVNGSQITQGRRESYPVTGARAEVSDFASGLVGRKHTSTITITLAGGKVLTCGRTGAGTMARVIHRQAEQFAAAVNSAAR